MEKKEIEELIDSKAKETKLLIDKKIADAKLTVLGKQHRIFVLIAAGALALFGVFVPFYMTDRTTDKVDKAVEKMEERFEALSGLQLRKPELECVTSKGTTLQNATLEFTSDRNTNTIFLRNIGEKPVDGSVIHLKLFIKPDFPDEISYFGNNPNWQRLDLLDPDIIEKKEFTYGLRATPFYIYDYKYLIHAKDFVHFDIHLSFDHFIELAPRDYQALLFVYYGEPEPVQYSFNISIRNATD